MKPISRPPAPSALGLPFRQLRITSVRRPRPPATVAFEIHDGSDPQAVLRRLVASHFVQVGDTYEVDSTVLDVWVTSK